MGVVNRWEQGHWCGGANILVGVLVDDSLKLLIGHSGFVEQDMVMRWPTGTLECSVGAKVEVVLSWMGHTTLNESTCQWVAVPVLVVASREEADVVAF